MFRVRLDKNFLNSPSLVVRMKEKYSSFSTAAPVLVSLLMSKVITLQSGSVWFSLVQSGSGWFSLVQSGSGWFWDISVYVCVTYCVLLLTKVS